MVPAAGRPAEAGQRRLCAGGRLRGCGGCGSRADRAARTVGRRHPVRSRPRGVRARPGGRSHRWRDDRWPAPRASRDRGSGTGRGGRGRRARRRGGRAPRTRAPRLPGRAAFDARSAVGRRGAVRCGAKAGLRQPAVPPEFRGCAGRRPLGHRFRAVADAGARTGAHARSARLSCLARRACRMVRCRRRGRGGLVAARRRSSQDRRSADARWRAGAGRRGPHARTCAVGRARQPAANPHRYVRQPVRGARGVRPRRQAAALEPAFRRCLGDRARPARRASERARDRRSDLPASGRSAQGRGGRSDHPRRHARPARGGRAASRWPMVARSNSPACRCPTATGC